MITYLLRQLNKKQLRVAWLHVRRHHHHLSWAHTWWHNSAGPNWLLVKACCTRWLHWRGKPVRMVSQRTSMSIWFHPSLFSTHALLHCLCSLYQNWPLTSLGILFLTRHLLSGIVSRQTFHSVILTLSSGNIWKHFCSLPPDWPSSSTSIAPHMALYK